jgi:phenylacetate-CoA ligase
MRTFQKATQVFASVIRQGSVTKLVEGKSPWAGLGRLLNATFQEAFKISQGATSAEKTALQNSLFIQLVRRFAHTNVFYKELLATVGVLPSSLHSVEDLERIPILSKSQLKQVPEQRLYSKGIAANRFWLTSTSGSTGEPFRFPWDAKYSIATYANTLRVWTWAGIDPRTPSVSCAGARLADLTPNTIHVPPDDLPARLDYYIERMRLARTEVIRGYPQTNFEFARMILKAGVRDLSFKAAFLMGNAVPRGIKGFFNKEFSTEVYDVYGIQEFGIVAMECEMHSGLHINEESFIVEIVDGNGRPIPDGMEGNIIITSFQNEIIPFIRYHVGDRGKILSTPCPCGRTLKRLLVDGRNEEMMIRPDGTFLSPIHMRHTLDVYVHDFKRYRVTQVSEEELRLELVLMSGDSMKAAERAEDEIALYAGPTMKVTSKIVDDLPLTPEGKFQCYVSQIWQKHITNELSHY